MTVNTPSCVSYNFTIAMGPVSNSPQDSHNLYNFSKSTTQDKISISVGDTRIEIGSSASDELILALVKAVRHA